MMKKIIISSVFTFVSLFAYINVFALNNIYYRNNNSVEFTEEEYNYFYEIYGIEYIDNMTLEEYDWYSDLNINNNELEVVTYYDIHNVS